MESLGMSQAEGDALIANLAAGVLPLSSTQTEDPVSILHEDSPTELTTTYVYSDGSRRVTTEQAPQPESNAAARGPLSLTGCTSQSGWQVNCKAKTEDAVSYASFVFDWRAATGGAEIRDMRAKSCVNAVGACSVKSGKIYRAKASGSAPAYAEMSYSASIGSSTVNGVVGVRASGGVASVYS